MEDVAPACSGNLKTETGKSSKKFEGILTFSHPNICVNVFLFLLSTFLANLRTLLAGEISSTTTAKHRK